MLVLDFSQILFRDVSQHLILFIFTVTTEKSILRNKVIEKNGELETVKQEVHALDKLRSQQTSRADQLLHEGLDLEKEVETLLIQVSLLLLNHVHS